MAGDLFGTLFEYLGKEVGDDAWLTELMGGSKLFTRKDSDEYVFLEKGIMLQVNKYSRRLLNLTLHFKTASVKSGEMTPFPGKLMNDIDQTDTRFDVRRKLSMLPAESHKSPGPHCISLVENYEFEEFQASFWFDEDGSNLHMCSISA